MGDKICLYMLFNFYTLRICFHNLIVLHSFQRLNFSPIHLRCQTLKGELNMSRELRAAHSVTLTD